MRIPLPLPSLLFIPLSACDPSVSLTARSPFVFFLLPTAIAGHISRMQELPQEDVKLESGYH